MYGGFRPHAFRESIFGHSDGEEEISPVLVDLLCLFSSRPQRPSRVGAHGGSWSALPEHLRGGIHSLRPAEEASLGGGWKRDELDRHDVGDSKLAAAVLTVAELSAPSNHFHDWKADQVSLEH